MDTKKVDQAKGLGDKVEAFIEKTMPKLAKMAHDADCGCDKRRDFLNNVGAIFSKNN